MGMYPSADLSYGIDPGEWEWGNPEKDQNHPELAWLTWELWADSFELETASATYLKANGVEGVRLTNYGHSDSPMWALATKVINCHGWGATTIVVEPEDMVVTDDDTRLLLAWSLLFPDREPGKPAWRLSATFD